MPINRYRPEQIVTLLRQIEVEIADGKTTPQACTEAGITIQLTQPEKGEVVTNCDHLRELKCSPNLPFVFAENGAVMLASVLNRPIALHAVGNLSSRRKKPVPYERPHQRTH